MPAAFERTKKSVKLIDAPHCNNLRIYLINHLNFKLSYTVRVANFCKHWFHLIFYIEMFCINPLESEDLSSSTEFMLTHARYLIYILIHDKLKKKINI